MSCPYLKESYFAICSAPNVIHVPTIDEMERFCFKSSYCSCPHIPRMKDSGNNNEFCTTAGSKPIPEIFSRPRLKDERGRDSA